MKEISLPKKQIQGPMLPAAGLVELEALFSWVPPAQLRKSVHEVFAHYLQSINCSTDMEQLKRLAQDFYFLNQFLEKMEEAGH